MQRHTLVLGFIAVVAVTSLLSFLFGVLTVRMEIFPYTLLKTASEWASSTSTQGGGPPKVLVGTGLHVLSLKETDISSEVPTSAFPGGGIFVRGNQLIGVTRRNEFYIYDRTQPGNPVQKLDLALDINIDSFRNYLSEREMNMDRASEMFGVIDVLMLESGGYSQLLASHLYWNERETCYTLRLSQLEIDLSERLSLISGSTEDWRVLWESSPCLRTNLRIRQFATHQSGGKMIVTAERQLLFSVGDFGFDGVGSEYAPSQDRSSDYGKILSIDLATGNPGVISIGHRNPQGLMIDGEGRIWSTEHGPQGGDELNIIEDGSNYGWPSVTYGTHYGTTSWPGSSEQGRHSGFRSPIYAWVPSIAVSSLIEVRNFSPEWDGDLLVSSLERSALHRIRYVDDRVTFVEPIEIGRRVRDIDQFDDGTIILLTDDGILTELTVETATVADGRWLPAGLSQQEEDEVMATVAECQECHSTSPRGPQEGAPNLYGIYKKQIAASTYPRYSKALSSMKGSWNDEALDAFLEDGESFAPGNRMRNRGISNPNVRGAIIRYLRSLKR